MDDIPVGGGDNKFVLEEFPPEQPNTNVEVDLPLQERLVSKTWSVRADAYKEVQGICKAAARRCDDEVFNDLASQWPTYLVDANPGALEQALDAFALFLDKVKPATMASCQIPVLKPLVEKCIGGAKPALKTKGLECALLMFEVTENFSPEVMEAITELCKSKAAKTQTTSVQLLSSLISCFGPKRVPVVSFGSIIETAASSTTPGLRTEGMNCYRSLYLWMGDKVEPLMENLKQQQKDTAKKEFPEHKEKNPDFKRPLRSEKKEKPAPSENVEEESKEAVKAPVDEPMEDFSIDVYDMAKPVDILSKYNSEWIESVISLKVWSAKVEKLQQLSTEMTEAKKLKPDSYTDLVQLLKKLLGDSNSTVCQNSVKAIGVLVNCLRANFSKDLCKELFPVLCGKFKERRLTDDLQTTLQAMFDHGCLTLADVLEHLEKPLKDASPLVRKNMAIMIQTALLVTYIDDLTDMQGELLPIISQLESDKDTETRDQGLKLLGICQGRLGVPALSKYVEGLIELKKKKVEEAASAVAPTKYDQSEKAKKKPALSKPGPAKKSQQVEADKSIADITPPPTGKEVGAKPKTAVLEFTLDDQPIEAPKRKPPPNIGKKPELKAKPAPAASKPANKPAGGPVIEDDSGTGLSKEEAIEKCQGFYDAAHFNGLEEAKWQDKVAALQGIQAQIGELKPDPVVLEATAKLVKARMKDWKESNVNLMKESVNVLKAMTEHCDRVPKRAVTTYGPFLIEKIGDMKMAAMIKEVLETLSDFVTAKFVALQICKHGSATKVPKNQEGCCASLVTLLELWGAAMMPVKECIDFGVMAAASSNAQVRTGANKLFAELFKHLGEAIRNFFGEIKDSTVKVIEAEMAKVTPYKKGEFVSSRVPKGDAAEEVAAAPAGNALDCLPREDISKLLTTKQLDKFKSKTWQGRKEAAEDIMGILKGASMRIEAAGLTELMSCMKEGMKESNKAVLKINIQLLGMLAEAIGEKIKSQMKKCFEPMVFSLSDKQSLVRGEVIACMNAWVDALGRDQDVLQVLLIHMNLENPEMREEGFKWVMAHKEGVSKCPDLTLTIKPLINCLLDKKATIRKDAEEVIVEVMGVTGFDPFQKVIKDLKPATQQTLKPIMEKAKAKCADSGSWYSAAKTKEEVKETAPPARPQTAQPTLKAGAPTLKSGVTAPTLNREIVAEPSPVKAEPEVKQQPQIKQQPQLQPKMQPSPAKQPNSFAKASQQRPQTARNQPGTQIQPEPEQLWVTVNVGNKEKRAMADARQKWMHEELKPEQVNKVQTVCEQMFGADFKAKMFSTDFKKHCLVLATFQDMITSQPIVLTDVIDVVFKWAYIKLTESSNTTFAVNVFDFFAQLFEFLQGLSYIIWDHEAYILVPLLCDKAGLNNAILKQKVKDLLMKCFDIYDHKKCVVLMMKFGVGAKNMKSVAEVMDSLAAYVRTKGVDCLTEKDVQVVAKLVDTNDKGVRENSLQLMGEIYKIVDDNIWRLVGNVPLKVKGLLEARFKTVKLGGSTSQSNLMNRSINQGTSPSKIGGASKMMTQSMVPGAITPRVQTAVRRESKLGGLGGMNKSLSQFTSSINSNNAQKRPPATPGPGSAQKKTGLQFNRPPMDPPAFREEPVRQSMAAKASAPVFDAPPEEMRQTMQPQQNQVYADDDEDLMDQLNQIQTSKPQLDAETKAKVDTIMKQIQSLKYGDLSKRVDALVALNEVVSNMGNQEGAICHCANDLCAAFTHVLVDIFERPLPEIPLRFAKYFVTIVNKTVQQKEIMTSVSEQHVYDLAEQLLTRLLIENLDKLGEQKEGDLILKNLNASMLRLLENCNPSYIFCVLFNLLRKYKEYTVLPKLPGLIIKCLLKLSKIIEKLTASLDMERILLVIHEYLVCINHDQKSQNDEMGIRIVKTVINELVKIKQESIWEAYKIVEVHAQADHHINRWISIILKSLDATSTPSAPTFGGQKQDARSDREVKQIIDELRSTDMFEGAIAKLHKYLQAHPEEKLDAHLKDLSSHFQTFIKNHLETYQHSLGKSQTLTLPGDAGSTSNGHNSHRDEQPQDDTSGAFQQKVQPSGAATTKALPSGAKKFGFSAQKESLQNSASSSRMMPRPTTAQTGSTGAAQQSNSDKMTNYADKLSSMRERFQAQKAMSLSQLPEEQKPKPTTMQKANSGLARPSATPSSASKQNMNTSFSAMNNSMSAKWAAISKKKDDASEEKPRSGLNSSANKFNSSNKGPASGEAPKASSQDLNAKLAEMKAKFQAMRKE